MRMASPPARPVAYATTVLLLLLAGACAMRHGRRAGTGPAGPLSLLRHSPDEPLSRFSGTYRGSATPGVRAILLVRASSDGNSARAVLTFTAANTSTSTFRGTVDAAGEIRCAGRPDTDSGVFITGRITVGPSGEMVARGEWMHINVGNGTWTATRQPTSDAIDSGSALSKPSR